MAGRSGSGRGNEELKSLFVFFSQKFIFIILLLINIE